MGQTPPIIQYVERPGILDLGWGHPNPSLLPTEQWREATDATLAEYGWRALTYGNASGPGPLLEWLATRDAGCRTSEIFVTGGASHGLALACAVLTEPGDVVLVDAPTYHLAFRVILDHRVEILAAPDETDDIEELITKLRQQGRRASVFYTVATFGNPTGQSMPGAQRRALVDIAQRQGLTIVEDDTYREVVYDGEAPPSLWSLARGEAVVRLGSFSKTIAPGLRLGWINAKPDLIRRLEALGYVDSGGGVNHATALTMSTFGQSGGYDGHVVRVCREYARQRDKLVEALPVSLAVPVPAGGWFVWVRLPEGVSAATLRQAAERDGVSFVEGSRFYPDGSRGDDHVRLAFSMLPAAQLEEAARRLAQSVAKLTSERP